MVCRYFKTSKKGQKKVCWIKTMNESVTVFEEISSKVKVASNPLSHLLPCYLLPIAICRTDEWDKIYPIYHLSHSSVRRKPMLHRRHRRHRPHPLPSLATMVTVRGQVSRIRFSFIHQNQNHLNSIWADEYRAGRAIHQNDGVLK